MVMKKKKKKWVGNRILICNLFQKRNARSQNIYQLFRKEFLFFVLSVSSDEHSADSSFRYENRSMMFGERLSTTFYGYAHIGHVILCQNCHAGARRLRKQLASVTFRFHVTQWRFFLRSLSRIILTYTHWPTFVCPLSWAVWLVLIYRCVGLIRFFYFERDMLGVVALVPMEWFVIWI